MFSKNKTEILISVITLISTTGYMMLASIYRTFFCVGIYATHPLVHPSSESTSASLGSYPGEEIHPFIPETSGLGLL